MSFRDELALAENRKNERELLLAIARLLLAADGYTPLREVEAMRLRLQALLVKVENAEFAQRKDDCPDPG